jgi:hypothetical protein
LSDLAVPHQPVGGVVSRLDGISIASPGKVIVSTQRMVVEGSLKRQLFSKPFAII